jgi:hypothetical protein
MKSGMAWKAGITALCALGLGGAFWAGKKSAKPEIKTWHELTGKYLIDEEISCANGKKLGRVQVDLNLTNGKVRVVRNDPGKEPDCTK